MGYHCPYSESAPQVSFRAPTHKGENITSAVKNINGKLIKLAVLHAMVKDMLMVLITKFNFVCKATTGRK